MHASLGSMRRSAGAAGADPEARAVWETIQSERAVGALHVVELVQQKGRLRPGLDRQEAIDIVWTLIEAGHYLQLVHQRGWSPERFQAWLTGQRQVPLT